MIDDGTRIIDTFLNVCKVVHPDFKNNGNIMAIYKRTDFVDLFETIGGLYHTLVAFHIPTKYLNIDIEYPTVKIKLDYKALKILCPVYGEGEEDEE